LNTPEKRVDAYQNFVQTLKAVPGVQTASAVSALPLDGGGFYLGRVFLREGAAEPPASPDYPGASRWRKVATAPCTVPLRRHTV